MKKYLLVILSGLYFAGCNNGVNAPDVSGIKVELETNRFEQDFFSMDTNNLRGSLQQLQVKYPGFVNDFVVNILGIPLLPQPDTAVDRLLRKFISDYRPIKDTADKVFSSLNKVSDEVKQRPGICEILFPSIQASKQTHHFYWPVGCLFPGFAWCIWRYHHQ